MEETSENKGPSILILGFEAEEEDGSKWTYNVEDDKIDLSNSEWHDGQTDAWKIDKLTDTLNRAQGFIESLGHEWTMTNMGYGRTEDELNALKKHVRYVQIMVEEQRDVFHICDEILGIDVSEEEE